jgi:hypothetical protein
MVAVMPHLSLILSMTQIALAVIWLFSGNLNEKFNAIKQNKPALFLSSLFFIHLIGLFFSIDINNGLNDLKIKLPLLLFPVIIAGSDKLKLSQIRIIIYVLAASLIIKSIFGYILLIGSHSIETLEFQKIAGKVSHIRLALLINITIYSLIYFLFFLKDSKWHKIIIFMTILWLIAFLFILHSLTGWVLFIILFGVTIIFLIIQSKSKFLKRCGLSFGIISLILLIVYIYSVLSKYQKIDVVDTNKLEHFTSSGNEYSHFTDNNQTENGHFVYLYICVNELEKEWNKLSEIKYDQTDRLNQKISHTLIRYLTSKNFRKDSVGVSKLTRQDIKNIENGMTNHIFENRFSVYPKIYEVLWQIDQYNAGASPEGHSVTQRIEFIKNGVEIIKENFWFGVGTGGQKKAYAAQYEKSNSKLSAKNRLRAHNQYITIFITLGVFGFLWFISVFIVILLKNKNYKNFLFLITFIIITLSMLNEDTIETQLGAGIFAFFLSLFLISNQYVDLSNELAQSNENRPQH